MILLLEDSEILHELFMKAWQKKIDNNGDKLLFLRSVTFWSCSTLSFYRSIKNVSKIQTFPFQFDIIA